MNMKHRLYGLRGHSFKVAYKRILAEEGEAIRSKFFEIVERDGKFSPRALGEIAVEFRLPLTILDDCLPDLTDGAYPSGTWERLKDRGVKARDIGVVWERGG